jgi:phosphotransacetylase
MKTKDWLLLIGGVCAALLGFSFGLPMIAFAHCDTMGGPVIQAAQKALKTGNVDLVLIWVKKKDETKLKKAFEETLVARKKDKKADMKFLEALVRIHREGEGEEYTGIKPAGEVEPGIAAADLAVDSGSADKLVGSVTKHIAKGIKERFERVVKTKNRMNESVAAGREYVEAYVEFIHYVEGIYKAAESGAHQN